jgi:O-antigen/teichoic acid export membrane protein
MGFSFVKNKNAKAGSFYLIGNLFDKAISFLTIPVFTRLLTTSEYGIVSTYLSWVTILSVLVSLSLGNSIRAAFVDFKDDLDSYISSVMFLSVLNFGVTATAVIAIVHFFAPHVDMILVVFCLVQSFMSCVLGTISIKYMMEVAYVKKTLLMSIPNVSVAILSVVFILLMNDHKYMGRIFAYFLVYALTGLVYLVIVFAKGKKFIAVDYWKYALLFSLPLVFHGLSMVLLAQADRIMITMLRDTSETGIYSLVYNFSMIALVVITAMENVWIPWFTGKMQSGDKKAINLAVKPYIEIVVVMVLGIMMVAPEVLTIMAPQEYWSGKYLIPPIVVASFLMFLYSIAVDLEYYHKSTKIIAINTIIAAVTNVILNYIFIPYYGAMAAAYTTVFSYMVSFGINYWAARRLDGELFPFKVYLKPIVLVILSVAIVYMLMDYMYARWAIAILGFGSYSLISLKKDRFSFLLK